MSDAVKLTTLAVSSGALREVLVALNGPEYLIRELQVTRGISALTGTPNAIEVLLDEFNSWVESGAPQTQDVRLELNAAINFAISEGIGAADFLRAWREGDTSEWPEFKAGEDHG